MIKGTKHGAGVNIRVPDDGADFYVKNSESIDSAEDLRQMRSYRVVLKVLPLATGKGSSRCSVHQRSGVLSEAAGSALGGPESAGA